VNQYAGNGAVLSRCCLNQDEYGPWYEYRYGFAQMQFRQIDILIAGSAKRYEKKQADHTAQASPGDIAERIGINIEVGDQATTKQHPKQTGMI
jgi:hypothetical protein